MSVATDIQALSERVDSLELVVRGDGNGQKGVVRKVDKLETAVEALVEEMKTDRAARAERQTFYTRAILTVVISSVLTVLLAATGVGLIAFAKSASPITNTASGNTVTVQDKEVKPTGDYTTPDLCDMLNYSTREIQDRAAKGEIPGAYKDGKAWRFDRAAVDAWAAAKAAQAAKDASAANAAKAKGP